MTNATADNLCLGIDLGGTKVEIALVDERGQVVAGLRRETGSGRNPQTLVDDIAAAVPTLRAQAAGRPLLGAGVGVAGQVDPATGDVWHAPNLQWRDVPLRRWLEAALALPVAVANDVQAATYGEWIHGAARGQSDVICVFIGTGVGGGVVAGGQLLTGCTGSAGEVGHITVHLDGPPCRCGNRGCLEAIAGGWAIARRARAAATADPAAGRTLLTLAGDDAGALTAAHVTAAVQQGDALAIRLRDETGAALAAGLASMVNAFNPCLLILGGGVIEGMPELIDQVRAGVRNRALAAAQRSLQIVKAHLGPQAGAIGAAALVRTRLKEAHG